MDFRVFFFIFTLYTYTPPLPSPGPPISAYEGEYGRKQNQLLGTAVLLIYLNHSSQYLFDKHDLT